MKNKMNETKICNTAKKEQALNSSLMTWEGHLQDIQGYDESYIFYSYLLLEI